MYKWSSATLGALVLFQKGRKVEVSDDPRPGFAPYLGASVLDGCAATQHASTTGAVVATENDVLMLWDGERSGLVGMGKSGVVSSTVAKLTPKPTIISALLYYLLDFHFEWIQGRRTGTGVPHVPKDLARILKLQYPSDINVQNRITEILSAVDEAIKQTEELISKTKQIKTGLINDLFSRGVTADGQLRAPREEAPHLYQLVLEGWVPRDWHFSQLGQLTTSTSIGTTKRGVLETADDIPLLKMGNLERGGLQLDEVEKVSKSRVHDWESLLLNDGDLLFNTRNTPELVGKTAAWRGQLSQAIYDNNILRVRFSESVNGVFLALWLGLGPGRRLVGQLSTGTTSVAAIYWRNLKRLPVPVPSRVEQDAIVARIDAIERSIREFQSEQTKMEYLKRGLMHDLLNGHVAVTATSASASTEVEAHV